MEHVCPCSPPEYNNINKNNNKVKAIQCCQLFEENVPHQ